MLLANWMIMQVIVPLLGGLVCFLLPKRFCWLFASVVMILTTALSLFLFKASLNNIALTYNLGGWSAAIGIEYKLNKLNSFFMFFISFAGLMNVLATKSLVDEEIEKDRHHLFFGLFLIAITGLLGVAISNDIFNIYVLLEVNSLASYALVASAKKNSSKKTAFEYLIFGTVGSTLILFGIGFLYALLGSLNLTIISHNIVHLLHNKACIAGMMLMLTGILMKCALFPLSAWLINIYQNAPSFVSALLAGTSNKMGIYLLLLFFFKIFQLNQASFEYLEIILLAVAMLAIFSCAILAQKQTNLKNFLAYSSLSQIGFIVMALALASSTSIAGVIIYCFTHALEKTTLFLAAGYIIINYTHSENIEDLSGFARTNPWLSSLLIVNLLSTVGFPMTAGFVGKWQILKASLASDIWYILIVAIAVLFTFSYVFKFIEVLVFKTPNPATALQNKSTNHANKSKWCLAILIMLTCFNLLLGINNNYIIQISQGIGDLLIK